MRYLYLDTLVDRNLLLSTGLDSPDALSLEAGINNLVYALYGLTPEEIEIVEGKG